jgi:hypothetical protein
MKRPYPLHLLFFGAYPVLFLYSVNFDTAPLVDVLACLGVSLAVAAAGWGMLTLMLKDLSMAALLTSLFCIWFFSCGHIHKFLYSSDIGHSVGRFRYFFPLWAALGGAAAWLLLRNPSEEKTSRFIKVANIFGAVLVVSAVIVIASGVLKGDGEKAPDSPQVTMQVTEGKRQPDIYYILPDAYTRSDVLKAEYGYDNQPFIDNLISKGFFIPSESCSNYAQTHLSLPSTLNMDYLQNLKVGNRLDKRQDMMLDSAVARFLKSGGYKLVYVNTVGKLVVDHYSEDDLRRSLHGRFWVLLLSTTAAKPLASAIEIIQQRSSVLRGFQSLEEAIDIQGPKFVFGHILCPHPPFVFGADGEEVFLDNVDPWLGKGSSLEELYADQVAYVNSRLEKLVERIIEHSETPPVIVIQADHGSGFIHESNLKLDKLPSDEFLRKQMRIFSAIRLPGKGQDKVYDSITPVNTFRVILNRCFKVEIPLLEDRCYYLNKKTSAVFLDVTERVRAGD